MCIYIQDNVTLIHKDKYGIYGTQRWGKKESEKSRKIYASFSPLLYRVVRVYIRIQRRKICLSPSSRTLESQLGITSHTNESLYSTLPIPSQSVRDRNIIYTKFIYSSFFFILFSALHTWRNIIFSLFELRNYIQ